MLLSAIFVLLILSALEDVRYLSAPQLYLYLALALSAVYSLQHAHYVSLAFVALALGWAYQYLPGPSLLLLTIYPLIWPLVILGAGKREGVIGEADLLVAASVTLISPWAGWGGLAGLVLFWALSKKRNALWLPAIPGILAGAMPFLVR
jgi:hypothetical protein